MCGTTHEHRVIRMIPGIHSSTNRKKCFSLGFQTCTHCQNPKRLAVGKRGAGGIPWGYWERFFGSRLFRRRDVWCLRWSERCAWFVLLRFVLMSSRAVVTVVVVVVAAGAVMVGGDGRGCACVCGPLTACLLWVCVLAWVWAVGRSGGFLWLLVVGCVRRMSSGPVVGGVRPVSWWLSGVRWWLAWCGWGVPAWGVVL